MIESEDGTLYTGVTTDIPRRFSEHQGAKKGARYFNGRRPLAVVFAEKQSDRSRAQQREAEIKKLRKKQKQHLIQHFIEFR